MENTLVLECVNEGEVAVVVVRGRLDAQGCGRFDEYVRSEVAGGGRRVIVDLGGLEYLSSAGVRSIISVLHSITAVQGRMAVCGAAGAVRDVLEFTGMTRHLPIVEDGEKARQYFEQ